MFLRGEELHAKSPKQDSFRCLSIQWDTRQPLNIMLYNVSCPRKMVTIGQKRQVTNKISSMILFCMCVWCAHTND